MPTSTPVTTTTPSYNNPLSLSGNYGTSGGGSLGLTSYDGPWRVERQTLEIHYVRTPSLVGSLTTPMALSGNPVWTHSVFNTKLDYKITASWGVTKEYGTYSTSSWQDNHHLVIDAFPTDVNGISYGDLSAGGSTCLGPAGVVRSIVPYYNRRAWVASDVESPTNTQTGYSVAFKNAHLIVGQTPVVGNALEHLGDFRYSKNPIDKGSIVTNHDFTKMHCIGAPTNQLPGQYSTSQESYQSTSNWIWLACYKLRNGSFFTETPELVGTSLLPVPTVILPGYMPGYMVI